ncbi:MAG: low specificity L-threonine aldolase [Methylobacteriaceae bacterium]|nr:low specificity L-threonine aldolase [Methylobacteriaceae bacterium]
MDFASDNAVGASPQVMAALAAANVGPQPAYGADAWTKRAEAMLSDWFERDVAAFLVATGTGANALALAAVTPPWGAVFCHEHAHIIDDECGAPEMASGGAKLVGVAGQAGKLTPPALGETLARFPHGLVKQVQAAAVSLSQATECGTLYTPDEIAALAAVTRGHRCRLHMDGARFSNALVSLGCTPAEMTWKAGVDVLSLGMTKNGALACEAVIFLDPALAASFPYQRKRGGHTLSKGRLIGAQMVAMLENGHWRDNAAHANAMARRLGEGLRKAGARIPWPIEANEAFVILSRRADAALKAAGARYHDWGARSLPAGEGPKGDEIFARLVASFATTADEVDRFVAVVAAA